VHQEPWQIARGMRRSATSTSSDLTREQTRPGILSQLIFPDYSLSCANYHSGPQSDGNVLCGWVDDPNGQISRMRFALIRKNALPQSESGGELRDLLLEDHEGICETTHVCIFPEGAVGVEFNFFGPRPQRLGNYLRRVVGGPLFTMEALIRQDMAEQLMRKRAIRRMTLRIRRSAIDQVEEANASLGDALRTAEQASGAECVGIILEPDPHQKTVLRNTVLETARRLMRLPGARTNFRQFQVDAVEDGVPGVTTLNLLEDKLIKNVSILRQHERSRVLQTEDAYQKIESAFTELRQDLLSAMSVNIQGEEGH
jgi:hypothetical protein